MKQALVVMFALVLIAACDSEEPPSDAGPDAAAPDTGPAEVCAASQDCDDGLYCTLERCEPGHPDADAAGCVAERLSPCGDEMRCVEDGDRCVAQTCAGDPDPDHDGHDSIACGGDDCDDFDGARYPGNPEVCDGARHDEDCDPTTVAGDDGDADSDGFTSAACCNDGQCGDDCRDDDPLVHDGVVETCDGIDQDCDGVIDEEGDVPLCPGGICRAGRCDLSEWGRTFGGTGLDLADASAVDGRGNVFVVGTFGGDATFGSGQSVSGANRTGFVGSYAADGGYRWLVVFGTADAEFEVRDVAYDSINDQLYVVGTTTRPGDVGNGLEIQAGSRGAVVALSTDGALLWHLDLPEAVAVVALDGPVIAGTLRASHSFGGGPVRTSDGHDAFVASLDSTGAHRWSRLIAGSGFIESLRATAGPSGEVAVSGRFGIGTLDSGLEVHTSAGAEDGFVVLFDPAGALMWDYAFGGSGSDDVAAVALDTMGTAYVLGGFEGVIDAGTGPITPRGAHPLLLSAIAADGVVQRIAHWGGGGRSFLDEITVGGIAIDASGNITFGCTITDDTNFGGGQIGTRDGGSAVLVSLTPAFEHRWDRVLTYPGSPIVDCPFPDDPFFRGCSVFVFDVAAGPADATVVTGLFTGAVDLAAGTRTSTGVLDGFVLRLGR